MIGAGSVLCMTRLEFSGTLENFLSKVQCNYKLARRKTPNQTFEVFKTLKVFAVHIPSVRYYTFA